MQFDTTPEETHFLASRLSTMITQMDIYTDAGYYSEGWEVEFEEINDRLKEAIENIRPFYNKLVRDKILHSFYYDCQSIDDLKQMYGLTSEDLSFILREHSRKYFTQR